MLLEGRDGSLPLDPLVRWRRNRIDRRRSHEQGKKGCGERQRVEPKKNELALTTTVLPRTHQAQREP